MKAQLLDLTNSTKESENKIMFLEYDIQQLKFRQSSRSKNLYDDIIAELNERKLRERYITLTGLIERNIEKSEERHEFDRKEVPKIMKLINEDSTQPIKTIRLGKYEHNKHRPIKVIFEQADLVKNILLNKKNESLGNIKICSDQTPEQQINFCKLKEKLQHRSHRSLKDYLKL